MNWLAHIFLSENNIDFQIGNYLADPLKAKAWENANKNIIKGMKTHKLIDEYTDNHIIFKQSKNRLGTKGLLKSVIIDLTYDYLLTKNWYRYSNIKLELFLDEFYLKAKLNMNTLSKKGQYELEKLINFDLLNKYKRLKDLDLFFKKIDKRVSKRLLKRDTASRYFKIVCENIEDLEKDFLTFFPQLCEKVKKNIDNTKINHWKI